jgi:hypothetical protein
MENSVMGRECSVYGGQQSCIEDFGGATCGKRPLGRPKRIWKVNTKKDLQEVGCGGTDWINLVWDMDRWWVLVNVVMNLRVP